MIGPGKVPPAKVALEAYVKKEMHHNRANQPSRETIGSDHLVCDLELAVTSVDDARKMRMVRPHMDSRARFGRERDCLQRTNDREEKDQRCQREPRHLERVENRGWLEGSSSSRMQVRDERFRPLKSAFCTSMGSSVRIETSHVG